MTTKLQIVTKVELDLDLQDEEIISPTEMTGYVNESIRRARALVLSLEEDGYFLKYANLALVSGTDEYALPTGILASKVRGIIYNNGTRIFEIKRIKRTNKFARVAEAAVSPGADPVYRWFPFYDDTARAQKIKLVPPAQETSASNTKVWFERVSQEVSSDGDTIDIPEAFNLIVSDVKRWCRAKMNNNVVPQDAEAAYQAEVAILTTELTDITLGDSDNELEMDLTHYEDHT